MYTDSFDHQMTIPPVEGISIVAARSQTSNKLGLRYAQVTHEPSEPH